MSRASHEVKDKIKKKSRKQPLSKREMENASKSMELELTYLVLKEVQYDFKMRRSALKLERRRLRRGLSYIR